MAPYLDRRVLDGASQVGLPRDPGQLATLAGSRQRLAQLAAALVRMSRGKGAAEEVTAAVGA